jgi:hypothetical protein
MTIWHVEDALMERWINNRETPQQAASVEQHLVTCALCRDRVRHAAGQEAGLRSPDLDLVWARFRDSVEVPPPSRFERILQRLGLPASDARLVATADAFRGPWMIGVLVVLCFVTGAAELGRASGHTIFLLVAPLLPSAAVAMSYDPSIEPALEQELVTPYPRPRLVLLRTIAVLAVGLPVVVALSPFMPGGQSFLWLLPAAGFVPAVLALSTWTAPSRAVAAISAAWIVVVSITALNGSASGVLDPGYRVAYLVVGGLSAGVFVARARHLRELRPGRSWS